MKKVQELSRENLEKSYENLEKAFTKKCQELSELRREMDEVRLEENADAEVEIEEIEEEIQEEVCEKPLELVSVEEEEKDEESCSRAGVQGETKEAEVEVFEDFRMRAVEFLRKNENARPYAKEISKILLMDKSLLKCSDPFRVAFMIAVANQSEAKKGVELEKVEVSNDEKQVENELPKEVKSKVQVLNSSMVGGVPRKMEKRYKNFEDARSELMRLFQ